MSEYTVIPLSEVRPGDIAVCNGREFPVIEDEGQLFCDLFAGGNYLLTWAGYYILGFEFRRPIPREPRTFEGYVNCIEFDGQVKICPDCTLLPCSWERKRVRITEVMEP
jgi:hypothetical protein